MDINSQLNAINWQHIQGLSPESIPLLIQRLLSESDESEISALTESLCRQVNLLGLPGEATLVTVPILIQLLGSVDVVHKRWILYVLQVVPVRDSIDSELSHKIYQEMTKGLNLFRSYLNHDTVFYRSISSDILAKFYRHSEYVAKWLLQRVDVETNTEVKCILIENIGKLLRTENKMQYSDTQNYVLNKLDYLVLDDNFDIRFTAATVYLSLQQLKSPKKVFETLLYALSLVNMENIRYANMTILALDIIIDFGEPYNFEFFISAMLLVTKTSTALYLWDTFASYCFKYQVDGNKLRSFSMKQKLALKSLLGCRPFWKFKGWNRLDKYGLEETPQALRKQLQKATITID